MKTQTWLRTDIVLTASKIYDNPLREVILDMEISNGNKTLNVPGFWNGGTEWCLRFALPEVGVWKYRTVCAGDAALDNVTGEIVCEEYSGDLAIFKHGFVTTDPPRVLVFCLTSKFLVIL